MLPAASMERSVIDPARVVECLLDPLGGDSCRALIKESYTSPRSDGNKPQVSLEQRVTRSCPNPPRSGRIGCRIEFCACRAATNVLAERLNPPLLGHVEAIEIRCEGA